MTPAQKAVLRARDRKQKAAQALGEALDRLRAEGCDHPAEHRRPWKWEYDNGYGRQSWADGERCDLCDMHKRWVSSNWSGAWE